MISSLAVKVAMLKFRSLGRHVDLKVIWGFLKVDFFGAPYHKDSSVWGSILGSPCSGKLPYTPD